MSLPKQVNLPKPINPRFVTKTSLPNPKSCIGLLVLLWYANGKPGSLSYGAPEGVGTILDDTLIGAVQSCADSHHIDLQGVDLQSALSKNGLVTAQLESLNAAFELVWPLATFTFAGSSKNRSAERTGGIRLGKVIHFTTSMDILDAAAAPDQDELVRVAFSWVTKGAVGCDAAMESKIERILTSLAETSFFKSMKGDDGIIYATSGIYDSIAVEDGAVLLTNPDQETQGPTRILKAAIEDGLNPFLVKERDGVTASSTYSLSELEQYSERARNGIAISNVEVAERPTAGDDETEKGSEMVGEISEPRNLIFFGAPGTGKSYQLNKLAEEDFADDHVRRVTFYPDYTYSQFVGCFKPMTEKVEGEDGKATSKITYRYVLGPFLETYVSAVKNPEQNYLLIVEEINRANPAAVFGDVFQLLDRDKDGISTYDVDAPVEMRDRLEDELGAEIDKLRIPANMFIWATMNSADQGVFPMDTAFKRRWSFRYIGIDDGEDAVIDGEKLSEKVVTCGGRKLRWNDLRHAINQLMIEDCGINEDKLLGPFFLDPSCLNDERFADTFKDKVLMYLYEDAGKTKRSKLFWETGVTFSQVCEKFDKEGEKVFGNGLRDEMIWPDPPETSDDDERSAE